MSHARIMMLAIGLMMIASLAVAREPRDEKDKKSDQSALPRGAKTVVELKEEGKFKLPAAGKIWLIDSENDDIVHSGAFGEGDVYAFNAKEDKVYRNGKELESVRLDNDRLYKIKYLSNDAKPAPKPNDGRPVPDSAKVVQEGRDKELSYETKADGMAFLYDASHDELIETFRLSAGDRVTVSPKSNAMSVNGKTVSRDIELDRKITYKLLFDVKK